MGLLGRLLPHPEARIKQVREITERETYSAFKEDGGFTEEECRQEARETAEAVESQMRKPRWRR